MIETKPLNEIMHAPCIIIDDRFNSSPFMLKGFMVNYACY
jgi:hypothetical protein